jgi:hypothetical protein
MRSTIPRCILVELRQEEDGEAAVCKWSHEYPISDSRVLAGFDTTPTTSTWDANTVKFSSLDDTRSMTVPFRPTVHGVWRVTLVNNVQAIFDRDGHQSWTQISRSQQVELFGSESLWYSLNIHADQIVILYFLSRYYRQRF